MLFQEFLPATVYEIFFVVARVGSIIMIMPGVGEVYVPPRIRISLAILISLLITPLVNDQIPPMPDAPLVLGILLVGEVAIGALIGMTAQILLSSLQTAGTVMAFQGGLANALIFNPATAQQSSIYSSFLGALGVLLVFTTDLHHIMFMAMARSYELFPPGVYLPIGDSAEHMAQLVSGSFTMAMQIAAPWIAVGLIFYLGVGLMARVMPQIQIFFVAMPLQLTLGFLIFLPTLVMIGDWFIKYFENNMVEFLSR